MSSHPKKERVLEGLLLAKSGKPEDIEEYVFNAKSCISEENEASRLLFLWRYE